MPLLLEIEREGAWDNAVTLSEVGQTRKYRIDWMDSSQASYRTPLP
jgi:hypothetical protein